MVLGSKVNKKNNNEHESAKNRELLFRDRSENEEMKLCWC